MRTRNTETMEQVRKFVEQFYLDCGRSPTTTEIANSVGIARSSAYRYLVTMDERGILSYDGRSIATDLTRKVSPALTTAASVTGSVPCGIPQCIESNVEEYVSLPVSIFGTGDLYIVRASGDSMIEAGIDDGDLVGVSKQQTADEGDIVVALVNNENTLKRFFFDHKRHRIRLHPENSAMNDIIVMDCEIQGVARHVIKAL